MSLDRAASPSDVSDEEWALVAPYLALLREDSKQRDHDLREVFNGLRHIVKTGAPWRFMPHDLPPWAAVYQQVQRWMALPLNRPGFAGGRWVWVKRPRLAPRSG